MLIGREEGDTVEDSTGFVVVVVIIILDFDRSIESISK